MKTRLLKRLRKQARYNVSSPDCMYQSLDKVLMAIDLYEAEKRGYILRCVAELKQKRK